jgi:hypothetical protein
VREFLLANSAMMVQDDSGIPLGYYDTKRWDLQPFGRYLGPIGVFPGRYQPKYSVLFQKSRPIDFGIGYRWRSHESNLLLAVKTSGDSGPEARPAPGEQGAENAASETPNRARQRRGPARQTIRSPLDWFRPIR